MEEANKIYTDLHQQFLQAISDNTMQTDPVLPDKSMDSRFGITLAIRFPSDIEQSVNRIIAELRNICPEQYYYAPDEYHITALTIITCHSGFRLDTINIDIYNSIIKNTLAEYKQFTIHLNGLIGSPAGILIKGHQQDGTLNKIRNHLRDEFSNHTVMHSIDQRYPLRTAHSTIMRFQQPLSNQTALMQYVEDHISCDIGTLTVDKIEFLFNDWYLSGQVVEKIGEFTLY